MFTLDRKNRKYSPRKPRPPARQLSRNIARLEDRIVLAALPGVTVTALSPTVTSESGGQALFSAQLDSVPVLPVNLTLSSSDVGEGVLDQTSLTFNLLNWNIPQMFQVTGVNDSVDDGHQNYLIDVDVDTLDLLYSGVDPADLTLINLDDDEAGVDVDTSAGLTLAEFGGSTTVGVQLESQPVAQVSIHLSLSDDHTAQLSTQSLLFDPGNWNTPQWVTIDAIDDDVITGDVDFELRFDVSSLVDLQYDDIVVQPETFTRQEDDVAGIVLDGESQNQVNEAGGVASFDVQLRTKPSAPVYVSVVVGDVSEVSVSNSYLLFDPGNWNQPQTVIVTGRDDDVADGDVTFQIAMSVNHSDDPNYANLQGPAIDVTVTDDDSLGISLGVSNTLVAEWGGATTIAVALQSKPVADVTVTLTVDDASEAALSENEIVFTPLDWQLERQIYVVGLDDDQVDGDVVFEISTHATSSFDTSYQSLPGPSVLFTNLDDDFAGITVFALSGVFLDEDSGEIEFEFLLDSQPQGQVTIDLELSDPLQASLSTSSLLFDSSDWDIPQRVTLTGIDDSLDEDDVSFFISVSPSSEDDLDYDLLQSFLVPVTSQDDDEAAILVTPLSELLVSESGGVTSIDIVLSTEPLGSVEVTVEVTDEAESELSSAQLQFDVDDWFIPQTIFISGQDDSSNDGDAVFFVDFIASSQADPRYEGLVGETLLVTNLDDDFPGVAVVPAGAPVFGDHFVESTFELSLWTQPTGVVSVVLLAGGNPTVSLSDDVLEFGPTDWNVPRTVTIRKTFTGDPFSNHPVVINLLTFSEDDPNYDGFFGPDIIVSGHGAFVEIPFYEDEFDDDFFTDFFPFDPGPFPGPPGLHGPGEHGPEEHGPGKHGPGEHDDGPSPSNPSNPPPPGTGVPPASLLNTPPPLGGAPLPLPRAALSESLEPQSESGKLGGMADDLSDQETAFVPATVPRTIRRAVPSFQDQRPSVSVQLRQFDFLQNAESEGATSPPLSSFIESSPTTILVPRMEIRPEDVAAAMSRINETAPEIDDLPVVSLGNVSMRAISFGTIGWAIYSSWLLTATFLSTSAWRVLDPVVFMSAQSGGSAEDDEDLQSLASSRLREKQTI